MNGYIDVNKVADYCVSEHGVGKKLHCIKLFRRITGWNLRESKEAIDDAFERERIYSKVDELRKMVQSVSNLAYHGDQWEADNVIDSIVARYEKALRGKA